MPWPKGKPRSEETRRRISEGLKMHKRSEEHCRNISESKSGEKNPMYGRTGDKNPFYGKHHSEETKRKRSEGHKGFQHSMETRRKMSEAKKGHGVSKATRRKMSLAKSGENNPNYGKYPSEETKRLQSRARKEAWEKGYYDDVDWETKMKEKWKNPEYRDMMVEKIVAGSIKKPNKVEQLLIDLFEENGLPFKYVGAGDFILGGKNPDFLNYNGKKQLIELYGDYWHEGDDPQERIDFFMGYGYDCLVVWEHEMSDPVAVLARVEYFLRLQERS